MNTKLEINGKTYTGTTEELIKILNSIEDGVHYNSSTKGRILISDMDSQHIKNSYARLLIDKLNSVKRLSDKEFLDSLDVENNPTLVGFIKELENRVASAEVEAKEEEVQPTREVSVYERILANYPYSR